MRGLLSRIDFGNEAGDDADPEELSNYFVEQSMFAPFVDPREKVLVATAKKGVGKSALIQWLAFRASTTDNEALVVKCRGADLSRTKFNLHSDLVTPHDHIRDWMVRICALVNRHLAANLNVALTDDTITLVEAAELDGFKSRNLVGCLTDRFKRILGKGTPTKLPAKDEVRLLQRAQDRRLWILIDDLDATFQNTDAERLELSTFFSACRYLAQDMKDICFRVSMRTDVWPIVRRYDESLDKMEQYVRDIVWEQADFRRLLYKRIKSEADRLGVTTPSLPDYVEDEEREEAVLKLAFVPKMPWGDQDTYTYRVIYTLSYHRPRWAIQLCKLAQKYAVDRGDELISKDHIDGVWGDYGKKRIADLVAEHKHQCQQIEELINGFRGCERRMTREGLFKWITNHISNHMTPLIEGKLAKAPIQIAQFLYRLGFIVARSEESNASYEHYNFSDMPDFLTSRTNEDFSVSWEIHPCYREALDIQKVNWSQRIKRGLRPPASTVRPARAEDEANPPVRTAFPPTARVPDLGDPTTVRELAALLRLKPHQLISELMNDAVFVALDSPLKFETAAKVASKHGVTITRRQEN